jgi:hypothetical protein
LLPTSDERRGWLAPLPPSGDEPSGAPSLLATASAAEVLNATARNARSARPAVRSGESLFTRTSSTIRGVGAITVETDSWTATDGSAQIVSNERLPVVVQRVSAAGGAVKLGRDVWTARPYDDDDDVIDPGARVEVKATKGAAALVAESSRGTEVTTSIYRAGSAIPVVTENGLEQPVQPPQLAPNWRYVVPGEEVVNLPAERDELLASLREHAERAAQLYRQPRPEGYYPRVWRQYELAGRDLLVAETATDLLVEAPLSPGQRAAMLSMLADAADWYQPGTSAEPIRIRNLGATKDALGRNGIALRFTIELTSDESGGSLEGASPGTFDLILEPKAGRLLETRSYEHGRQAEPVPLTVVAQRVVDSR